MEGCLPGCQLRLSLVRLCQEPGECQGGRPRAHPPAALSQNPDSVAHEACQSVQPRQALPSGQAVHAGFWARPRRGWVSLCGSRMPSTLRDTGPGQRPQLPSLHWPRVAGPWWGRWAQLESPSSTQWSCSVRALSGGPLMFITKQPASWRPCGSQTAKRAGDDSEIPL